MPHKRKSHKKVIDSLHHRPSLEETLQRMSSDGKLSAEKEQYIREHLDEWMADSKYTLFNLGAHIALGFFRFTVLPFFLPVGSILRVIWVVANRLYCDIRWDMHRKQIHSLKVLLIAAIPFVGYLAYTIPLRNKSEYLTYLYAQHVSYGLYDKTLEEKIQKAPALVKKIAYRLLVPSDVLQK